MRLTPTSARIRGVKAIGNLDDSLSVIWDWLWLVLSLCLARARTPLSVFKAHEPFAPISCASEAFALYLVCFMWPGCGVSVSGASVFINRLISSRLVSSSVVIITRSLVLSFPSFSHSHSPPSRSCARLRHGRAYLDGRHALD